MEVPNEINSFSTWFFQRSGGVSLHLFPLTGTALSTFRAWLFSSMRVRWSSQRNLEWLMERDNPRLDKNPHRFGKRTRYSLELSDFSRLLSTSLLKAVEKVLNTQSFTRIADVSWFAELCHRRTYAFIVHLLARDITLSSLCWKSRLHWPCSTSVFVAILYFHQRLWLKLQQSANKGTNDFKMTYSYLAMLRAIASRTI